MFASRMLRRASAIDERRDLIFDLRQELGGEGTYAVISAYRWPKTNEMLRGRSSGVVGYYASPDCVHIDTGRVRRW